MRHYTALFLAVLGAGCWHGAAAQSYYDALYSDNGIPYYGVYGDVDYCSDQTFAYALDFKYDDLDDLDFIGGDSVKLYCRDENNLISGYISSLEGSNGEWQGIHSCPEDEYFIGFRLRVFPEQGTWGDDFAVDNIQLACSNGTIVDGLDGVLPPASDMETQAEEEEDETIVVRTTVERMGRKVEEVRHRALDSQVLRAGARDAKLQGLWGSWAYCTPGYHVVAIRTIVEEGHVYDDMGLCDVTLYCS